MPQTGHLVRDAEETAPATVRFGGLLCGGFEDEPIAKAAFPLSAPSPG
jgi:hypothetical protein